jgi:DNA-binding response OmpR family regulator
MPEMDGFEALKQLRRTRQTAGIPVTMLTMRDRHGDVLTGFRYGAQEYLTKPVTIEEVLNSLQTLLGRGR